MTVAEIRSFAQMQHDNCPAKSGTFCSGCEVGKQLHLLAMIELQDQALAAQADALVSIRTQDAERAGKALRKATRLTEKIGRM